MQRIVSVAAVLAGFACLLSTNRTEAADNAEMNIVQTAVANGHFKTLAKARRSRRPGRRPRKQRPLHGLRADRRSLRQDSGREIGRASQG